MCPWGQINISAQLRKLKGAQKFKPSSKSANQQTKVVFAQFNTNKNQIALTMTSYITIVEKMSIMQENIQQKQVTLTPPWEMKVMKRKMKVGVMNIFFPSDRCWIF